MQSLTLTVCVWLALRRESEGLGGAGQDEGGQEVGARSTGASDAHLQETVPPALSAHRALPCSDPLSPGA